MIHPSPHTLDKIAAARRRPTAAMVAKTETIGRRLDAVRKSMPRHLPPGTLVIAGTASISPAEFAV